jgi:hypothetical protein
MRTFAIFAVATLLTAAAAVCRETPQGPDQSVSEEAPASLVGAAPLPQLALPVTDIEDCAEFRELALAGDTPSLEAYLSCID